MKRTDRAPHLDRIAAYYAKQGIAVVPLVAGQKRPRVEWKPYQESAPTTEQVRQWWTETPQAGIGIVCGTPSGGLIAIDLDDKEIANAMFAARPELLGQTPVVRSGKGGHIWIKCPLAMKSSRITRGELGLAERPDAMAVEIHADGTTIVAPPTIHPSSGKRYEFIEGCGREPMVLDDPAAWLCDLLADAGYVLQPRAPESMAVDEVIPEGARNTTLASVLGAMRRQGANVSEMMAAARAFNERCVPPMDDAELERTVRSMTRYKPTPNNFHRTDAGNAELLADMFCNDLRYLHAKSQWVIWNQHYWKPDRDGEVVRLALLTVRARQYMALEIKDDDEKKKEMGWAIGSESNGRLGAMATLARNIKPLSDNGDGWDANPWLLCVKNGVVDLQTGALRDGRPDDRITKCAGVTYEPTATCPRFTRFLAEVQPGEDVRAYLQRAIGYALTADVSEQVLFFLYGSGANGKSTLVETILAMLGDYGKQAAPGLLMAKQYEQHPTELADLAGARFVASVEVEDGKRLAEGLIKQATGGDTMKARFMRQDFFSFRPEHKLFLLANHKPIIRGDDYAIWRRIKLIPFTETIPPERQDHTLAAELRTELPGILNWAIQGCLAWQHEGLGEPEAIRTATAEYKSEMDLIGEFIEEKCEVGPEKEASAEALFNRYTEWAKANNQRGMSKQMFGRKLSAKGYHNAKRGPQSYWKGLA